MFYFNYKLQQNSIKISYSEKMTVLWTQAKGLTDQRSMLLMVSGLLCKYTSILGSPVHIIDHHLCTIQIALTKNALHLKWQSRRFLEAANACVFLDLTIFPEIQRCLSDDKKASK